MHIVTNDDNICYCVEHCGHAVVAAIERNGILTKYYYPEEYSRNRSVLSMEMLYLYQYNQDSNCDVHRSDEHAPYAYKDPDTLMALLSSHSDIVSCTRFFDDDIDTIKQLFGELTSCICVNRYLINRHLLNPNKDLTTVAPVHASIAEQHICQGEYIAKLHDLDDPIWAETITKVMAFINDTLDAEEEKFNVPLDELRKLWGSK